MTCFQRPWCETGSASCWPEDEAAGKMFLSQPVKKYVSASPGSLKILQKLQEEDKKFDEIKKDNSGLRIDPFPFDIDEDYELPF